MYNNAIEGEPEGRWNVHPAQTCGDRPVNILRATARGDRVNVAGGNSLIEDSTIRSSTHKREQATVVVVPRESFRASKRSLESILSITGAGYKLVYVDGGSPRRVRRYLENQARKFQFTLIRTEHYLSPNEARNLGLQYVQSKYVVFIDNDVVVAPGWLDGLLECAEDTGAWVVGALYCIGEPVHQIVHMAGGESGIAEVDGKRTYHEHHDYVQEPLAEALNRVQRHETEIVEFHCMLVRRDAFNQTGPLDEALLSAPEHADFCLTVRQAGGSIFLEPRGGSHATRAPSGRVVRPAVLRASLEPGVEPPQHASLSREVESQRRQRVLAAALEFPGTPQQDVLQDAWFAAGAYRGSVVRRG